MNTCSLIRLSGSVDEGKSELEAVCRDLLATFARLRSEGRVEALASLFTPEGSLSTPLSKGRIIGTRALLAHFGRVRPAKNSGSYFQLLECERVGEGARVRADYVSSELDEAGDALPVNWEATFHLRQVHDTWLISTCQFRDAP